MEPAKKPEAWCIVLKIGTRVLTHDDGSLALGRLFSIVEDLAAAHSQAREVLLVSSGAVGLGREALAVATVPTDLADRQAFAAVGQSRAWSISINRHWRTRTSWLGKSSSRSRTSASPTA